MKKLIMVILLVMLIGGVGYIGISIYANVAVFNKSTQTNIMDTPSVDEAQYIVKLVNTGRILYTDHYTKDGVVYTLIGYWELSGNEFVYHEQALRLDEKLFGAVLVNIR